MNKSLQMKYYHGLRKTNPSMSKTKEGRSILMKEAVFTTKVVPIMSCVSNMYNLFKAMYCHPSPTFIKGSNNERTEMILTKRNNLIKLIS